MAVEIPDWGASRIDNPSSVLVVGSGSREHAILDSIDLTGERGGRNPRLYALPGNGGTAGLSTNIDIPPTEVDRVVSAARDNGIEFAIIGPERPMAMGLTDALEESGIQVFGHTESRMRLESSKADAVGFMERHGIPHPESRIVTNVAEAQDVFDELRKGKIDWKGVVVKADGLAEGKGVLLPKTQEEALEATLVMLRGESFGEAGRRVVLQERVRGVEASMIGFVSNDMGFLVPARDYKALLDNDEGPNTGGMGAYAPNEVITPEIYDQFIREIAIPTQEGMHADGLTLTGPVYFGLMITEDGPVVLEYNMRFGDPETAVQLALFRGDLLSVMQDTRNGVLNPQDVKSNTGLSAVGVFSVSEGYPKKPITGRKIEGLSAANRRADVYHAGTRNSEDGLETSGGRVTLTVATSESLDGASLKAYGADSWIDFVGKHRREDIGR